LVEAAVKTASGESHDPKNLRGEMFPFARDRPDRLNWWNATGLFIERSPAGLTLALVLAGATLHAESADELIQKGDHFYEKLQAAEALRFYLPAEKLDPENVRLLVRIAREYRHLMSDAAKTKEKLLLGNTAVSYAERAVALAPNDSEAQLSPRDQLRKRLPLEGTKQQLASSQLIKIAVDKAIALDPTNDLSWQVLGRWYRALADGWVL
jgi:tetratricopeptide (TPR) repeat protein